MNGHRERRSPSLSTSRERPWIRRVTIGVACRQSANERERMNRQLRRRFWFEVVLGVLSTAPLGLTVFIPDWIEGAFESIPTSTVDRSSGRSLQRFSS
jgi:hypothetical protein